MVRIKMLVTVAALALLAGSLMAADPKPLTAPLSPTPGSGGAIYMVDQNHPKASDDNPGTVAAPWKTIGKAATVAKAGDTIYVMAGDYPEVVTPANSGAEGKPVVFKGLPRWQAKVLGFDSKKCPHLWIEGFRIEDGAVGVAVNNDDVSIVDNDFEGVKNGAIMASGESILTDTPVKAYVAFNEINKCGKGLMSGGSGWLIERNEVKRLCQFGGGDCDYTRPFGVNHVLRWNHLHGSFQKEVAGSHVDCFQVFDNNGYISRDVLVEENVCSEMAEGLMMEHYYGKDNILNWTFRRNIFFQRGTKAGWADHGLCGNCPGLVADGNTFITGSCGAAHDVKYINNLFYGCLYFSWPKEEKNPEDGHNLLYDAYAKYPIPPGGLSHVPMPYEKNKDVLNKDPLFANLSGDNVRLKKGSPAIKAGLGGATIGALEYPNVYYVDLRHPGADDKGYGYPGWPFKTVAKALATAEDDETVVLRGGVYRELVKPAKPGLTIKAMKGEKVIISGADEISGWKRDGDKWTAALAAKPTKVLKDGKPFAEFTYNEAAKTITVTGFDPRLSLLETVVRPNAIDLSGAPGTKIVDITTADTLGEGTVGK